jgi:hypothetical protein
MSAQIKNRIVGVSTLYLSTGIRARKKQEHRRSARDRGQDTSKSKTKRRTQAFGTLIFFRKHGADFFPEGRVELAKCQ